MGSVANSNVPVGQLGKGGAGMAPIMTAKQHGMAMQRAGVKPPEPHVTTADVKRKVDNGAVQYGIRGVDRSDAFVLVRGGYATVYAHPGFKGYRSAYEAIAPGRASGLDVDHLRPKSTVSDGYVALGSISASSNRSHGSDVSGSGMTGKVFGQTRSEANPPAIAGGATAEQYGRAVTSGYMLPLSAINLSNLDRS